MKYGNKPKIWFGRTFDSIAEWKRYLILRTLEDASIISDLILQKEYEFYKEDGDYDFTYIADFTYVRDFEVKNEDVKNPYLYFSNIFSIKREKMEEEGHNLICVPATAKYLSITSEILEEECRKYWKEREKKRNIGYNNVLRRNKKYDSSGYKILNYL